MNLPTVACWTLQDVANDTTRRMREPLERCLAQGPGSMCAFADFISGDLDGHPKKAATVALGFQAKDALVRSGLDAPENEGTFQTGGSSSEKTKTAGASPSSPETQIYPVRELYGIKRSERWATTKDRKCPRKLRASEWDTVDDIWARAVEVVRAKRAESMWDAVHIAVSEKDSIIYHTVIEIF